MTAKQATRELHDAIEALLKREELLRRAAERSAERAMIRYRRALTGDTCR